MASQSGVGAAEFQEAGDFLGQLARCCQCPPLGMRIAAEEAMVNVQTLRSLPS